MTFGRNFAICGWAIDKTPIEECNPPLNEEEKKLYESYYKSARIRESHGLDPNELKLGFYSDCFD